jgi:thiamine-phosphate pyrophosphorylase
MMASKGNRTERRPAVRLYLTMPPVAEPSGPAASLAAALAEADVAAVLVRLNGTEERTLIEQVKLLAPTVQERGVALLLERGDDVVIRSGADGAHCTGLDQLRTTLAALKPDRIVGCGGLASRHEAMVAGEAGADYVMFGEPSLLGPRPRFETIVERVAWWADLFELPCVGYAATPDEVGPLGAAGADFVALGEWVFAAAPGPARAVAEAARELALSEVGA